MESFKKAIFLASTIIAVLAAEDGTLGLEEKFELMEEKFELMISENSQLKTEMAEMEEKFRLMSSNMSQLKTDNSRLTTELESLSTLTAFDCYLTEEWSTSGIIQFNGCSGTISYLIHLLADFYQTTY